MRTKYSNKNKINIVTLGCSKNIYDSEIIMGQLGANNKDVVHEGEGNIVVINTCGFINNAKEESINTILHFIEKKQRGEVDKVFVTGCLSERYKDDLRVEMPDVDDYFGTTDLPLLLKALGTNYKHELIGNRLLTTPKHYAFLKISEGCDRPCSFCAIPLMRGKHHSRSIESLLNETRKLAKEGVVELILIAQDLTYYGLDLYGRRRLSDLLEELCKVDGIEWIRLHYAFPTGFPMDVIEVMARESKICNYLDMPLQHISDNILKSMKRGTTGEKTMRLVEDIRKRLPNITLRTTLIVGYPGEDEDSFLSLKNWVKSTRFERLGCFAYSHEENTKAYSLKDDVPIGIKKRRVNELMEIQAQISWEINQMSVGRTLKCIIDRKEKGYFIGRSEADSPDVDNEILIDASKHFLSIGRFAYIKITKAEDFDLYGEPEL